MKEAVYIFKDSKTVFWTLLAGVVLLLITYIFYANSMVHNAVSIKNIEKEMVQLKSKIGELEFSYISVKNSINLDVAKDLGFVESKNITYISRKPIGKTISLNNEI